MKIIKNPKRLALKLFILVWVFLVLQIVLKLTFNYWQPYVIPTPQLQTISDFIDNNRWLEVTINGVLYVFNTTIYTLICLREWWFKKKWQAILTILLATVGFIINVTIPNFAVALILSIIYPLILKPRNWWCIILAFIFSNLFQFLSFWLEGFTNDSQMNYVTGLLLNNDYYIMLILNYILFNFTKRK